LALLPHLQPATNNSNNNNDDDDDDEIILPIRQIRKIKSITPRQEAESYLVDMASSSNILSYWAVRIFVRLSNLGQLSDFFQVQSTRWSSVFRLSLDLLSAQGTSVPCERVFSSAKLTKSDLRNRLSPELMEATQVLKFTLKRHGVSGPELDFTGHLDWKRRIAELEELCDIADELPPESASDYATYILPLPPLFTDAGNH
jgi:hypothetical protein